MSAPPLEITPQLRTFIVLNHGAGAETAEGLEAKLDNLFRTHGIDARILRAGEGVEFSELLTKNEVPEDALVVAGGGDGTVNAVAAELVGTARTLGVLPLGTLNHFAKDLGIPLDLEGAVATVAAGQVSKIDVGEVNGRIFVNNSGLGIYPQVVEEREADQKQRGSRKWPAFARATVNAFRRYPFLQLRVHLKGEERLLQTAFVFIGNNEYEITGMNLGARACLNGGRLGFYVANRTGRFGLLRLAFRALVGRLERAQEFEAFCIDEARIESGHRSLLVSTDGEITRMTPPLHYRIRPAALRVLVPRKTEDG